MASYGSVTTTMSTPSIYSMTDIFPTASTSASASTFSITPTTTTATATTSTTGQPGGSPCEMRDALSPLFEAVDELEEDSTNTNSTLKSLNGSASASGSIVKSSPASSAGLNGEAELGAEAVSPSSSATGTDMGDGKKVNLKTSKRAVQNRAAQRAFRERKEKHMKDLESKAALYEEMQAREASHLARIAQLEQGVSSNQSQSRALTNSAQPPRISLPSISSSSSSSLSLPDKMRLEEVERAKYDLEIEVEGLKGSLDESRRICAELRRNLASLMKEKREREADGAKCDGSGVPGLRFEGGSPVKRARVWE